MQKIVSMKDLEISELNTKLELSKNQHLQADELGQLDGAGYRGQRMDGLGDYKSDASLSGGEVGAGHAGFSAGSQSRGNSFAVTPERMSPRRMRADGARLSNASGISQGDQFADLVVQGSASNMTPQ